MNVTLDLVPFDSKSVLANLIELYNHDMSEFYDELQINEHGRFEYRHLDHYWTEEGRFPYLIRANGALAGFVLVRSVEGVIQIAEFFVLRNLRGHGVGLMAARQALALHPGAWEIWHAAANTPAAALWRAAVPADATRQEEGSEIVYRFHMAPG